MPRFCVKKPYTVLVGVIMVLILGVISFTKITTDLLPTISLPYVIAVTTYPGASPEKVESSVTQILESSLGTVNGVENVNSTSSENYSMVMLEFAAGTNMDSAMVKLSSAVDQLGDALPDEAGTPTLMEISPDMLPTMMISLNYEGKDIKELTKFVEDEVIPYLERQEGVASVSATGLTKEHVEIRLNKAKIDEINDKLLAKVSDKFADAKKTLDESEDELAKATKDIKSGKKELTKKQDSTYEELVKLSQMIDEAVAMSASFQSEVASIQASQAALQAEKSAYEEKVVPLYKQMNAALSQIPVDGKVYTVSDIVNDTSKTLFNKVSAALNQMLSYAPNNQELKALVESFTWDNLVQLEQYANVRIKEINAELSNLNTELAAAQAALEQVNSQVEAAKNNYATVEKGKLSAAAAFGAASAQLTSGESQLANAQTQLDAARDQYKEARKAALKSANIDQLVTMETLSQLIYAQNFEMPAGYISSETGEQFLLKIGEEFSSLDEVKEMLLCKIDGVGNVRLEDVADITILDNSGESYSKINGNDSVSLNMMKASTSGTSDVSKTLNKALEELEEEYEGLEVVKTMDQGDYIALIVKSVLSNLIWGAVLAIIVLAVFLKDPKPIAVVAFSIPLSVLFAIVLMYFSDVTLNIISLSGLALGVGMLVDNSIVVIENIYRLRGEGVPAAKAAVLGARQVSGAIFASTLTTICVFLPIVFTEGMTRELFTDMGLTIAYSLMASLIVALTVVPAMSATALKKTEEKPHPLFDKVIDGYEKLLRFCLKRRIVPIAISLILLIVSILGVAKMGMELIPSMNGQAVSATVNFVKEGMSQDAIYEEVEVLTEELMALEGADTVTASSGETTMSLSGGTATELITTFTFYVLLNEEYSNDADLIADKVEEVGKGKTDIYEMEVSSSDMDLSALGGSGMQIDIKGEDLDTLLAISEDVMGILEKVEGFEEISNGQEEGDLGIQLVLNKDKAMKHGLTVAQILGELSSKLTTEKSAVNLTLDGNEYEVKIIDETNTLTKENLLNYTFETKSMDEDGKEVTEKHKLKEFATTEDAYSISSISRTNQGRHMNVTAVTKDGYNTTLLSREVEDLLKDYQVPEGYEVEMAGEVVSIKDTMGDMVLMIALAIAFIYLIMVAQFQSLLSPFIVIFTIPLAFTGGFLALILTGQNLSIVSMIGFLVLVGVVVNNGIVFVDYTNQLRLAGWKKKEALIETGKTRMRPILMTAMTTILAMSTLAFDQEITAAMSRGMATVTIGGLLYATLMTLFIIPVLYDIFFRRRLSIIDVDSDVDVDEENIVKAIEIASEKE